MAQVGHALGLAHPDAGAKLGLNFWYSRTQEQVTGYLDYTAPTDLEVNCTHPWVNVEVWPNVTDPELAYVMPLIQNQSTARGQAPNAYPVWDRAARSAPPTPCTFPSVHC